MMQPLKEQRARATALWLTAVILREVSHTSCMEVVLMFQAPEGTKSQAWGHLKRNRHPKTLIVVSTSRRCSPATILNTSQVEPLLGRPLNTQARETTTTRNLERDLLGCLQGKS